MKSKVFQGIFLFLIVVFFSLGTFFLIKGFTSENSDEQVNQGNPPASMSSVDINQVLDDLKSQHEQIVYESKNIPEFTSLVFLDGEVYSSFLIDSRTGKEISFQDLFIDDKWEDFLAKEQELLAKKYPEFIVQGILNTDGVKEYWVKENELIIYYKNYTYEYEYTEAVTLKINYQEIKDFISFTPVLDLEYENEDGYHYQTDKKTVAITFDDGPSSKYNGAFLETLAKNKAHATFFMVGTMMYNCQKCVLDTYQSGNEVASHSYNHMNLKKSSIQDVKDNLDKVNQLYTEITGDTIKYVRPPYGAYSKENLENIDVPLILWNLDTEDWRYRDVDHIVNYVMDNVQDGSIILMHELYETSLEALKVLLPKLYAAGYQVVSVGELATLKGKTLEAGHAYRAIMS